MRKQDKLKSKKERWRYPRTGHEANQRGGISTPHSFGKRDPKIEQKKTTGKEEGGNRIEKEVGKGQNLL